MQDRTEIIETTPNGDVRNVTPTPRVTEVRTSTAAPDVDRLDTVAYDPYESRRIAAARVTQLVYWVFGLIEGLIAIRFVLKALGANAGAGFAEFIYGITAPLVAPFFGLFGNPASQGSVLEMQSLIALVVYGLVAWLLGKLVWILTSETRSAVRTRSTHYDTRV